MLSYDKILMQVPNTNYTFLNVVEQVLKLLISDSDLLSTKEVLYRKHMARAYYNLVSKFSKCVK